MTPADSVFMLSLSDTLNLKVFCPSKSRRDAHKLRFITRVLL
jgi:hypothetical protein